ncbi:MAG: hypothetical protein WD250_14810 [Egibacteraceae bacterium]
MNALAAYASADLRSVWRDPFTRLLLAGPLLLVVIVRLAEPVVARWAAAEAGVRAADHHAVAAAFLLLMVFPFLVGSLMGLLILDQRDEGVLTALRVTPVSLRGYTAYRSVLAMTLTGGTLLIALPASGLLTVALAATLPAIALSALLAPLPALLLAGLATNKVEGMAVLKAMGLPLFSPLLAGIVDAPWRWVFAVVPTFWPAETLWRADAGTAVWPVVLAGSAYLAVLVALSARHLLARLERGAA